MDFCTCKNGNVPAAPVLAMVQAPVQPWETLYDPEKALREGTVFPSLDQPFYAAEKEAGSMDNNMDRMQLMKEIGEASFMVNDLTLYLDTHPTDQEALKAFSEASKKRRELMEICADQFEPLTMDLVCPDTNNQSRSLTKYPDQKHFTWSDGPMPWEGGAL